MSKSITTSQTTVGVLIAYRNRDLSRVQRCLASICAQRHPIAEIIFVDYGSATSFAGSIRVEVESIPMAKYIYINAEGLPFNKSIALNRAFRVSSAEILLLIDIDLILSPSFVTVVLGHLKCTDVVAHKVVYLPRTFRRWDQLNRDSYDGPISQPNSAGLLCLPANLFSAVGGFDECFANWGYEDTLFVRRLQSAGYSYELISACHVYHQWHPLYDGRRIPPFLLEEKAFQVGLERPKAPLLRFPSCSNDVEHEIAGLISFESHRQRVKYWLTIPRLKFGRMTLPSAVHTGWSKMSLLIELGSGLRTLKLGESIGVQWEETSIGTFLGAWIYWTYLYRKFLPVIGDWQRPPFCLPNDALDLHWFIAEHFQEIGSAFYERIGKWHYFIYVKA